MSQDPNQTPANPPPDAQAALWHAPAFVILEDGQTHALPDAELKTLQKAVKGWIDYLPEAFHALRTHEVVLNDSYLIKPFQANPMACQLIGFDLERFAPLRGPVVLVKLGRDNQTQREEQEDFYAVLWVTGGSVAFGDAIDARIPDDLEGQGF